MGGRQAQKLVQKYTNSTVQKGGAQYPYQSLGEIHEPQIKNILTKQAVDSREILIQQDSVSGSTGRQKNRENIRKMNSRLENKIMRQSLKINRNNEKSLLEKDANAQTTTALQ